MTGFALRCIPIFILIVALRLAFGADAAMAQAAPACTNDQRYVKMLGTHQGQPVCMVTGTGVNDPISVDMCLNTYHFTIVTFNGYRYCVWPANPNGRFAGIVYGPGGQLPPDHILYPTPVAPVESVDAGHCTNAGPTRYVQTLGKWRNVTLCQWTGSGVVAPRPEAQCGPGSVNTNSRVKRFGVDFGVAPPPSGTPPPFGTRFCVHTASHRWEFRGQYAAIMASQPASVCVESFYDTDGDGVRDSGEGGLAGVVFSVTGIGVSKILRSEPGGWACLAVPQPGPYVVRENVPAGYVNTDPGQGQTPPTKTAMVQAGQVARLLFGNHPK